MLIKEFTSQSDAEAYIESNPQERPFVYYVTGVAKLFYDSFLNGGQSNYKQVITSIIDGSSAGSVDIEEGITKIRRFAFYQCKGITNISIPSTVESIGTSAFRECTDLQSIEIPDTVTVYDGNTSGYMFNGNTSMVTCKYFKPSALTAAFPTYEFNGCTALTTLTLDGSTYTSIAPYAFQNCSSLTSPLNFPNVTTINSYAFNGCTHLNPTFGTGKITTVQAGAFQNCKGLTSIDLSNITAAGIHFGAFNGCSSLQSITIREGVTTLPSYAFNGCSSLTSVTLPSTLTATGFTNGTNIQNNDNGRRSVFANCTSLTSFTLLSTNCVSFPQYYLQNCTSLTNSGITIPDSITTFQGSCFAGCTSLTKPVYRNDRTAHTSFGTYCFNGCTGITSLDIPAGQTSFPAYIFNGCTGLTGNLTLPSNITSIGEGCFQGCTNITYFKASEGFTSLGKKCFFNCSGLITVDLPSTFTTFVAAALGAGTFQNCTSMTTLIIRATTPPANLNAYTFQGIKTGGKIYVPKGSLATYQAVAGWYTTNSNYWPKKMGWTLHELDANGNIPA